MRRAPASAATPPAMAGERVRARAGRWAASISVGWIGLAFAAFAFLVDVSDLGRMDEAWFLQVVERVASGDALYRDVWFGTLPLSVYMILGPVAAFGADVVWVKLLVAASCGASAALAVLLARRLRIPHRGVLVLALAAYVASGARPTAPYPALATVFLLGCFLAAVTWLQAGPRVLARPAVAVGASAGLALSTKYTAGLLALAAAVVTFLVSSRPWRTKIASGLLATGICAVTVAVVVVPALVQGPRAFLDSAFGTKGTYVSHASVSFFGGLRYAASRVTDPTWNASIRFVALYWTALFLVTIGALTGTAWAAWSARGERRIEALAVLLFTAAALCTAYPRFDYAHLLYAAPAILVGAAFALTEIGWRLRFGRGPLLLAVALALPALVLAVRPAALLVWGGERVSGLPHFRAAIIDESEELATQRAAASIRAASQGRPLFVLSGEAGLYYLVAGVRDPTRYDFPLVTTLGSHGENALIRALEDGRLRRVCLDERLRGRLAPARLIAFVRHRLARGRSLGPCRLYR